MKNRIAGLNRDEVNYAWSFELITPENGIVIAVSYTHLDVYKRQLKPLLNIFFYDDTEECILTGAALLAENNISSQTSDEFILARRKTTQSLLPLSLNNTPGAGYHIFPSYKSVKPVYTGFDSLAEKICHERAVIIDGYGAVLWEPFREQLQKALGKKYKKIFWYDISTCLHSPDKINSMLAANLNGDDPVFGKKYTGHLDDFLSLIHI